MIKKMIPFKWKARFQIWRFGRSSSLPEWTTTPAGTRRIFLFMAADYGNLGDVAITYAQHKFLQSRFQGFRVVEIPISCTLEGIAMVKKTIRPDDIVTTIGGGNMGDLYPMIEHFRQLVIEYFPDNTIISFPQTADFRNNKGGQNALKKTIRLYSKHPDLVLLAREQKTFDFFKRHFPKNKSFMVPDIVMTLDIHESTHTRAGAIICLRDDKEKKLSKTEEAGLLKIIEEKFNKIDFRDTHIGGSRIPLLRRTKELFSIWSDFSNSEIVVTDRLHGMIFSYVTNTPALVFLNNNHKIKSSYEWIKHRKNIRLIEEFDEGSILKYLDRIHDAGFGKSNHDMAPYYKDLLNYVNSRL